jgi:hypothetical protein
VLKSSLFSSIANYTSIVIVVQDLGYFGTLLLGLLLLSFVVKSLSLCDFPMFEIFKLQALKIFQLLASKHLSLS